MPKPLPAKDKLRAWVVVAYYQYEPGGGPCKVFLSKAKADKFLARIQAYNARKPQWESDNEDGWAAYNRWARLHPGGPSLDSANYRLQPVRFDGGN